MRNLTVDYEVFGYRVRFKEKPIWKGRRRAAYLQGGTIVVDSTYPIQCAHRLINSLIHQHQCQCRR